jgi:hypothetical protein
MTGCPLFMLPRELRDRIWEYALTSPDHLTWPCEHFQHNLATSLLRTCRTIYRESVPALYTKNTFLFTHPSDLNMFISLMDRAHVRQIAHLVLRMRDRDARLWTSYLGSTVPYRSLMHDVRALKSLDIRYRSSFRARLPAEPQSFHRWVTDSGIENLVGILQGRTGEAVVRVVCVHKSLRADVEELVASHPDQLSVDLDGNARTAFKKVKGIDVCLEFEAFQPQDRTDTAG